MGWTRQFLLFPAEWCVLQTLCTAASGHANRFEIAAGSGYELKTVSSALTHLRAIELVDLRWYARWSASERGKICMALKLGKDARARLARRARVMPRAFYFGCWGQLGHFLHDEDGGRTLYDLPAGIPWSFGHMDGGLLKNGKIPDREDGRVHWTCGGRAVFWFAFFWWDNSVDRRGAANSGFYVEGFASGEKVKAFEYACGAFPSVVARQRHQLVLQP